MRAFLRAARAVDELLFPRAATCLGCGDKSGCSQQWLCDCCVKALDRLWRGDRLQPCPWPLERFACAYAYTGPVAGLVHALKYGSVGVLAGFMASDMVRASAPLRLCEDVLIVPAPMHPRRERKRGYNHAALLATAFARQTRLTCAQALTKTRNTRQQARLSYLQRQSNLAGSFAVCGDVRGKTVLLIDDVCTSGATLSACASALLDAGAARVWALSYASALKKPAEQTGR